MVGFQTTCQVRPCPGVATFGRRSCSAALNSGSVVATRWPPARDGTGFAAGDPLRLPLASLVAPGDAPDGMAWEASSDESIATARIVGAALLVQPEPEGNDEQ